MQNAEKQPQPFRILHRMQNAEKQPQPFRILQSVIGNPSQPSAHFALRLMLRVGFDQCAVYAQLSSDVALHYDICNIPPVVWFIYTRCDLS
jgi:hypothetical protein